MKNDLPIFIALGLLVAWNSWLSLPKKEDNKVNYELFQELYKQSEQRIDRFKLQINEYKLKHEKDSIFLYNASDKQLDSLRAIYNPR